jgi:hypothetical protein
MVEFVADVAHVADVAVVAIVIDGEKRKRAKFPLPLVDSRSIIGYKKNANKGDQASFNILQASAKYNTYNVYNTSNTCID